MKLMTIVVISLISGNVFAQEKKTYSATAYSDGRTGQKVTVIDEKGDYYSAEADTDASGRSNLHSTVISNDSKYQHSTLRTDTHSSGFDATQSPKREFDENDDENFVGATTVFLPNGSSTSQTTTRRADGGLDIESETRAVGDDDVISVGEQADQARRDVGD